MSKLVLFDIDMTLVDITPLHAQAYKEMFAGCFGINATYTDLPREDFAGKTTPYIIEAVLKQHDFDDTTIALKLGEASKTLDDQLVKQIETAIEVKRDRGEFVLDGVDDLLNYLSNTEDYFLSAYTGNFRRTAEAILEFTGLDTYFPVRAFGDDPNVRNRTEIISLVLERSIAAHGKEFDPGNTFVFGDSIYDIRSAKELGLVPVGIATGYFSTNDLARENPASLLINLQDTSYIAEEILRR